MNNFRLLTGMLAVLAMALPCPVRAEDVRVVTLDEIFTSAENNSRSLRPLITAEKAALEEIEVAKTGRLPKIEANLSLSFIGDGFTTARDFSDAQKAPIPHFGNGLGVKVEQPVYTGGAITAAIDMANLRSTAAKQSTDSQRDNIRFMLTGYYLDLYRYANLRTVVEGNIAAARKILAEMNARFNQGTALRNDITRYELLLANLELQLVKINNTLDILNHNLVTTAGLPDGTVVRPDTTILDKALPEKGETAWQQCAADNSPSLKLARTGIDMARKNEDLVKADRMPKVGLQASWSIDGPILVEVPPINRNLSYWYVGVGVSYNLSSLYTLPRRMKASRLAVTQAAEQLAAAEENIEMAVRSDYIRYMEAYEELKTQTKSVELAERNYNTTSTRYSADMALITDMLDAANAKLDAEQQLVNARINIIYCYYKLLFSTGTI